MANGADIINKYLISKGITPTQGDKFPLFDVRKDLYNKLGLNQQLGNFIGSGTQNYSMLNQLQKAEKNTGVNINPNNLSNVVDYAKNLSELGPTYTTPSGAVIETATGKMISGPTDTGTGGNVGNKVIPPSGDLSTGNIGDTRIGVTGESETLTDKGWLPTRLVKPGTTGGTIPPDGTVPPAGGTTGEATDLTGTSGEGLLPEIPTGSDLASQALDQVQSSATFPLQLEAQEAQKSAVQLQAQRDTQDFIKNIASRGLFFSGAKSEGVSNIEVDKLANLLNIDRSFAMLMAQGLETSAQQIAKEAAKGRTEAIDALASLGYAINPVTNTLEPTLQAQQQQANQQLQQQQLQQQQQQFETKEARESYEFEQQQALDIAKLQASLGENVNKILSPNEAATLGVPYGTTVGQATSMGIVPKQLGEGELSTTQINMAFKLTDDYEKASSSFVDQVGSYNRIVASAQEPSAAGDLSLIFNYMKMLDPASVVREGEFATAANTGSIPQTIAAKYNKVLNGERLSSSIRQDFVDRAEKLYQAALQQQEKTEVDFTRRGSAMGIPPEYYMRDLTANIPNPSQLSDETLNQEFKTYFKPEEENNNWTWVGSLGNFFFGGAK